MLSDSSMDSQDRRFSIYSMVKNITKNSMHWNLKREKGGPLAMIATKIATKEQQLQGETMSPRQRQQCDAANTGTTSYQILTTRYIRNAKSDNGTFTWATFFFHWGELLPQYLKARGDKCIIVGFDRKRFHPSSLLLSDKRNFFFLSWVWHSQSKGKADYCDNPIQTAENIFHGRTLIQWVPQALILFVL